VKGGTVRTEAEIRQLYRKLSDCAASSLQIGREPAPDALAWISILAWVFGEHDERTDKIVENINHVWEVLQQLQHLERAKADDRRPMKQPYDQTLAELRRYCRGLATIEVLGFGAELHCSGPSRASSERIVGRDAAGTIVVEVKGRVTPAAVQKFRNAYQRAVAAGIIKEKNQNA
jgi:hypothetical protein